MPSRRRAAPTGSTAAAAGGGLFFFYAESGIDADADGDVDGRLIVTITCDEDGGTVFDGLSDLFG